MAVQWLGLRAVTAEGTSSIPGGETTVPQPARTKRGKKTLAFANA